MELIKDKVAIVTGAAAGIGAGVAGLFAANGAHVFLADLDGAQVKKVAAALQAKGGSAFGFEANAGKRHDMAKVVEDAISRFGRIDILINNAGIYPRQPFLEMTEEHWDTMHDINLKSVFHCTKLVVPHMVKGGFVFGAEGGKGVATCRTANGWSAPAFFTITGGSWGLQIGIEGIDLVMIIQNEEGMKHLINSNFELGGDASAAAGPVGRHASADTDWKLNTEVLTYSRAKGAFAGLTLTGAAIRRDNDSTEAIYGHDVPTRHILDGHEAVPASAESFLAAVREAKHQAVASN